MFILLLGHLGSAGVGLDLKATCQERTRQLCLPSGPPFLLGVKWPSFVYLSFYEGSMNLGIDSSTGAR